MKVIKWTETLILAASLAVGYAGVANAAESTAEKVKNDTKKTWNKAKDESCEMVNGKMECAGKRAKHRVEEAVDKAKDKVD